MKEETILSLPIKTFVTAEREFAPLSEISNIRYFLHTVDSQYIVHSPAQYFFLVKRIIDLTLSMIFIVLVMSWLTPLLALMIKLSSKGPVFFLQKRTGLNGNEFTCYKFRTMLPNEDAHTKQVSINDKNITWIGRILRITHLDETAQFFNVLLGDMSIIGPRPHMVYHTSVYAAQIPYYDLRLQVKPGITGMAQIKNYIGEINDDRELRKRVQWDIYYVMNQSISLDMKILFTSFIKVFAKLASPFFKSSELK